MFVLRSKNEIVFPLFFKIKCELETWTICSCSCHPDGLLTTGPSRAPTNWAHWQKNIKKKKWEASPEGLNKISMSPQNVLI